MVLGLRQRGMQTTLTTSIIAPAQTVVQHAFSEQRHEDALRQLADLTINQGDYVMPTSSDSTVNGVLIGLLSSFGSAVLIAFIFLVVYFFRYTSSGRILLDRIGRPGEYDDEQAYAREEAEALEEMDDLQRTEYLRAKGMV